MVSQNPLSLRDMESLAPCLLNSEFRELNRVDGEHENNTIRQPDKQTPVPFRL